MFKITKEEVLDKIYVDPPKPRARRDLGSMLERLGQRQARQPAIRPVAGTAPVTPTVIPARGEIIERQAGQETTQIQ